MKQGGKKYFYNISEIRVRKIGNASPEHRKSTLPTNDNNPFGVLGGNNMQQRC